MDLQSQERTPLSATTPALHAPAGAPTRPPAPAPATSQQPRVAGSGGGASTIDPSLELEAALAVEDVAVLEASRANLVETRRRVLSQHLSGAALAPGNGEVFERTEHIDEHVVRLSAVRAEVQVEHIRLTPRVESARCCQRLESTCHSSHWFPSNVNLHSPTAWRRRCELSSRRPSSPPSCVVTYPRGGSKVSYTSRL